jgi:hypothetical protein
LAEAIEAKHGVPVALVDATRLTEEDIHAILTMLTERFPIRELTFRLPDWYSLLPDDHPIITDVLDVVSSFAADAKCFGDVTRLIKDYGCFGTSVQDAGVGEAVIEIPFDKGLYMQTLSDAAGI